MRVTIVADVLGIENNGTTITAINFINSLKERGHEVSVVCPDENKTGLYGYYVVPSLNLGIFNDYVKKNNITLAKADTNIITEAIKNADIVHIMMPFFLGTKAARIARRLNKPITAGFHVQAENFTNHVFMMDFPAANLLTYKVFYRLLYRFVDAIHYPTQFIRDVFEGQTSSKTNGYVISNGVNKAFAPRQVAKPEHLKDRYVILFTGRYSREKSHKILIDAVKLSKYKDKIQLVFAGDGPQKENIINRSSDLANVPILGFHPREELIDIINYADLYVHPAEIEIEAISCLEAMSCGLVPVIADSKRSATRYFALSPDNLFRCNDPLDLAHKIDYWLDHPQEKEDCRQKYIEYAKRFDFDYSMDQMEKMLIDVIKLNDEKKERLS
ncbi:MAG: glycosyltransferase [Bacilli bacterium]|jgi:glycosyltransferase involved in cell wall biosynthesis